jgi:copper(I)-binding protein
VSKVLARPAGVLLAGALTLSLSACGAGFNANTYDARNLDDASNTDVGAIALRNVYLESPDEGIVHPAGSDARLKLTISNNGDRTDRLVAVRTDAASSAQLVRNGRRLQSLELKPGELSDPELEVELIDLTRDLRSGESLELTVEFENNGSQTFLVPVGSPELPEEREHSKNVGGEEKG